MLCILLRDGKRLGNSLAVAIGMLILVLGRSSWAEDLIPDYHRATVLRLSGGLSWDDNAIFDTPTGESPVPELLAAYAESDAPEPGRMPPPARQAEREEPLGQAPEDTSRLFLREATVLLGRGHMDVDCGLRYTWDEVKRASIVPTPRVVDTQRARYRALVVPLAVRYGLTRRSQLYCNLPVGASMSELSHRGGEVYDGVGGLGDLSAGVTCLLREHQAYRPDWTLTVGFIAPTGPSGLNSTAVPFGFLEPNRLYLGQGFWGLNANLNFIRSIDPVVLFGGVGYLHQFSCSYLGVDLQPGESFNYQFGVGFAVNDRITLSTIFFGLVETTWTAGGRGLPYSSQEPFAARCAVTISASRCWIVEPFFTFGLNEDAPEADLGINLTRRF